MVKYPPFPLLWDGALIMLPCAVCCLHFAVLQLASGVNPRRFLEGFGWPEFQWRRGELTSQFEGCQVRCLDRLRT